MRLERSAAAKRVRVNDLVIPASPGAPAGTAELDDRSVTSVRLEPGESLAGATGWLEPGGGGLKLNTLLLVLHGSVATGAGRLEKGWLAHLAGLGTIAAGDQGAVLGVITWRGEAPDEAGVCQQPDLQWFDKYEAKVGTLHLGDGPEDRLAPWSGYAIEIPAGEKPVTLHVHDDLKNLIFIVGRPGAHNGYVVAEDGGDIRAWPVESGDVVLVETGVLHNLVPADSEDPLEFFVFNDTTSNYEEQESSDYHIHRHLAWTDIERRERRRQGTLFIHVGT